MDTALALLVVGVGVLIIICYKIRRDVAALKKNYWMVNRNIVLDEYRKDRESGMGNGDDEAK